MRVEARETVLARTTGLLYYLRALIALCQKREETAICHHNNDIDDLVY